MLKVNKLLIKYLFLLFNLAFLFGCGGTEEASSLASPLSSTEGPQGQSDGLLDGNYFYVGVDAELTPISHVHKTSLTVNDDSTTFSQSCGVISSASPGTGATAISCTVDIPEAELFVRGLDLKHHVPPGMCRFLTRTPYWFYNKEVGRGPSSIAINKTYNASNDLTSYDCVVDSVASPTCSGYSEVNISITKDTDKLKCVYDTTGSDDGANCCTGDYTVVTTKTSYTGSITTDTKNLNWGTTLGACINPTTATNWPFFDSKSGLPNTVVDKTQGGTDGSYKMTAPIDILNSHSTISIANSFAGAHTHTGLYPHGPPNDTTPFPYFVVPIDDRSDTLITPASGAYVYDCRDEAFEIKHRISVYVREWDTYQDYSDYVNSKGAVVTPSRSRTLTEETGGCVGIEGLCNDFYDSDDFLTSLPFQIYGTTTTTRVMNFPFLIKK